MDNENIKEIADSINNLSSLIEHSLENLNKITHDSMNTSIASSNTSIDLSEASTDTSTTDSLLPIVASELSSLAQITTSLNTLKTQLNFLKLNDYEILYVANCISPLLQIIQQLSSTSSFIMTSTQLLNNSTTTKRKSPKIKRSEKTAYKILEQVNCVYSVLECRIYTLINDICDD